MSGAVSSYVTRHLQALFGALGRLTRAPLATTLTLIVIGVALALPAGLALIVNNLRDATGDFSNAVDFSVHFKPGTPIERVQQLAKGARARAGVESVTVTTADEALEEFKQASGFGDALTALEDNPLPHHLVVDMHATVRIGGLTYLPQPGATGDGNIGRFQVAVNDPLPVSDPETFHNLTDQRQNGIDIVQQLNSIEKRCWHVGDSRAGDGLGATWVFHVPFCR